VNMRGMLPRIIGTNDISDGLNQLSSGVEKVVGEAIKGAMEALDKARTSGATPWPRMADLSQVWYSGGSAAVPGVPRSIDIALVSHGIKARSEQLSPPIVYSTWNPDRYREMSCAAGASRWDLQRPQELIREEMGYDSAVSPWDKDAG
jgi:X-X-X-Leu-X-X-Gly heptad repeat protein